MYVSLWGIEPISPVLSGGWDLVLVCLLSHLELLPSTHSSNESVVSRDRSVQMVSTSGK